MSTKEPFKCVINQGIILGEVSRVFSPTFSNYKFPLIIFFLIVLLSQVQYTAWKDQEGNYVSADNEEWLNEHQQVTIPEEKV